MFCENAFVQHLSSRYVQERAMKKRNMPVIGTTSYLSFMLIMKSSMISGEKRQENEVTPGSLTLVVVCSLSP